MRKTIVATVAILGAFFFVAPIFAEEAEAEESSAMYEAGFDFDLFTAYVWRNQVANDEPVAQPCVWADFTGLDPFWFGFSVWQNYDLTRRRNYSMRQGLTETDYNLHAGMTMWESEDESQNLQAEFGHEWTVNHNYWKYDKGGEYNGDNYHSTRELYLKLTYENEIVNVYGMANWLYMDPGTGNGMHYEVGFNRDFELTENLTFGADWNVNFGDSNYLMYLHGYGKNPYYDDVEEEWVYEDVSGGIAGTTLKFNLTWQITDWCSLGGVIAYTGTLHSELRDTYAKMGKECGWQGSCYRRDLLWGGIQLKFTF